LAPIKSVSLRSNGQHDFPALGHCEELHARGMTVTARFEDVPRGSGVDRHALGRRHAVTVVGRADANATLDAARWRNHWRAGNAHEWDLALQRGSRPDAH
jgi:hypothetical protein